MVNCCFQLLSVLELARKEFEKERVIYKYLCLLLLYELDKEKNGTKNSIERSTGKFDV